MHRPRDDNDPPDYHSVDGNDDTGDHRWYQQEVLLPATNPNPLRRGGSNYCGLLDLTGERVLCTIQAVGWLGICAQSFFWTTWRGEVRGCADLSA